MKTHILVTFVDGNSAVLDAATLAPAVDAEFVEHARQDVLANGYPGDPRPVHTAVVIDPSAVTS